jgi:hypothetical protein
MNASTLQSGLYKIIVRGPPALVSLDKAMAKGHDLAHYADTEAEMRAKCGKLVQQGYVVVEVTGPNVHWDRAEVLRQLNSGGAK